jgi:hypothetical protein
MNDMPIFDGRVPKGERGDGCLVPSSPTHESVLPRLTVPALLTDEEIDDRLRALKSDVLDRANETPWIYQGNQGSCTTAAAGHCIMERNAAENEPVELLSQASLYAWDGIDSDGKPIPRRADNGMALSNGILLLRRIGMAPVEVDGEPFIDPMDYRGWRDWPDGWRLKADDNLLLEWRRTRGLREIKAALARPSPVLHGYAGHARMLVWYDPDRKEGHAKNSWRSQKWHRLDWRQIELGDKQYESFTLISTAAR